MVTGVAAPRKDQPTSELKTLTCLRSGGTSSYHDASIGVLIAGPQKAKMVGPWKPTI